MKFTFSLNLLQIVCAHYRFDTLRNMADVSFVDWNYGLGASVLLLEVLSCVWIQIVLSNCFILGKTKETLPNFFKKPLVNFT